MNHYNKAYQSPSQLVDLLKSRGLQINDSSRAEHYLRRIGYFRFSAYLYPLLTVPKDRHIFKNSATFGQALNMYRFDRQLRLLMFNQIEKIEIAVRSAIVNIASRETNNPFWMTDSIYFYDNNLFLKA
ncbi:MAG: Abi family protein, partial [Bacteroidales bacterium]|nr:Abi family protein [Bacteroidales bacterium]